MAALMEMTGWQAHTLRAALSGLRKEGLMLTRRREGDDTIYATATVAVEAAEADVAPTNAATGAETPPIASGVESAAVEAAETAIQVTGTVA